MFSIINSDKREDPKSDDKKRKVPQKKKIRKDEEKKKRVKREEGLSMLGLGDFACRLMVKLIFDKQYQWKELVAIKNPRKSISLQYLYIDNRLHVSSFEQGFVCVLGQCVVPRPPEHCYRVCIDFKRRAEWDKRLLGGRVLHSIDSDNSILHLTYGVPPHKPHDLTLFCTRRRFQDGSFAVACRSVQFDGAPPVQNAVRCDARVAGHLLRPEGSGTRIFTLAVLDVEKGERLVADDILGISNSLTTTLSKLAEVCLT